eukprot:7211064-Prymnesium_polylepis.1
MVLADFHGRTYDREFADSERAALEEDCNVRTGIPLWLLRRHASMDDLRRLLDTTRTEHQVEAEEASSLLSRDEESRVYDFVLRGSPSRRSLLIGTVPAARFLDTFLVGHVTELVANGRSLRRVVQRIKELGGLDEAAARVPWLSAAVRLTHEFDFGRLARELPFVRRATDEEADGALDGVFIEEGQHRAIAAAWIMSQHNDTAGTTSVGYLRG